jgi:hypothetical protein
MTIFFVDGSSVPPLVTIAPDESLWAVEIAIVLVKAPLVSVPEATIQSPFAFRYTFLLEPSS